MQVSTFNVAYLYLIVKLLKQLAIIFVSYVEACSFVFEKGAL